MPKRGKRNENDDYGLVSAFVNEQARPRGGIQGLAALPFERVC